MRARWPILAILAGCGVAWIGYPYVTLYRLDLAVRHADAAALRSIVDWYAVREGLKEDIRDRVLGQPANGRPAAELAPFGEGFVRGIAGNAIDRSITPESLLTMTHAVNLAPRAEAHVEWAFFDTPTEFSIQLRTENAAEPVRMVMALRGLRWRVERVWLPDGLLERANSGT